MKVSTQEHFIALSSWRFADTMAAIPHEYTVRQTDDDRGRALSAEDFDWFAACIFEHGERGQFRDFPPQTYLTVGPYYYWTMGEPGEDTNIINRALVADRERPPAETRARALRRARLFLESVEVSERWDG